MGKVSTVIIMDWSLERPAILEVMYWLTEATILQHPGLRLKVVSSAVPVLRRRNTEEDLLLYRASSNMLAVLESKILLLLDI